MSASATTASLLSLVQAARYRTVASGFVRGSAVGVGGGDLGLRGSSYDAWN